MFYNKILNNCAFLFILGYCTAIVISDLQTQHRILKVSKRIIETCIPFLCAASAVGLGFVYVLCDDLLSASASIVVEDREAKSLSNIFKVFGAFIGFIYASTRALDVSDIDPLSFSLFLAVLSFGLWFSFDRTGHGFAVSLLYSLFGTFSVSAFVYLGYYSFNKPDILNVQSFVPSALFAASVTFGSLGRELFESIH